MKSTLSSVQVVARIKDTASEETSCFQIDQEDQTSFVLENKVYKFDRIFYGSNGQIFQGIGSSAVDSLIEGYNGCIFVYGQTGTGKTYTMTGNNIDNGLTQNCFLYLQNRLKNDPEILDYTVKVSYYEIYNENVVDLLSSKKQTMQIRQFQLNFYIQRLTEVELDNFQQFEKCLKRGISKRQTKNTNMNEASSRSHSVLTIYLTTGYQLQNEKYIKSSKLNLVDLAGSQRQKEAKTDGSRLKEGANINKSLLALTQVISKLSICKGKNVMIPYRQSALTKLLKDSLGGNSKTTIIGTLSSQKCYTAQSKMTLNFLLNAKKIINKVKINQKIQNIQLQLKCQLSQSQKKLKQLQQQNQKLKMQLKTAMEYLKSYQYQNNQLKNKLQEQIRKNNNCQSIFQFFNNENGNDYTTNLFMFQQEEDYEDEQEDGNNSKTIFRGSFLEDDNNNDNNDNNLQIILQEADSSQQVHVQSENTDVGQEKQNTCQKQIGGGSFLIRQNKTNIIRSQQQSQQSKQSKVSSLSSKRSIKSINANNQLLQLQIDFLHKQLQIYRQQDSTFSQYLKTIKKCMQTLNFNEAQLTILKAFEQRAINAEMHLEQNLNKINLITQHYSKYRMISVLQNNKLQIQNLSKQSKLASDTYKLKTQLQQQRKKIQQLRNQIYKTQQKYHYQLYKKNQLILQIQSKNKKYQLQIQQYQQNKQKLLFQTQQIIIKNKQQYNQMIIFYQNKLKQIKDKINLQNQSQLLYKMNFIIKQLQQDNNLLKSKIISHQKQYKNLTKKYRIFKKKLLQYIYQSRKNQKIYEEANYRMFQKNKILHQQFRTFNKQLEGLKQSLKNNQSKWILHDETILILKQQLQQKQKQNSVLEQKLAQNIKICKELSNYVEIFTKEINQLKNHFQAKIKYLSHNFEKVIADRNERQSKYQNIFLKIKQILIKHLKVFQNVQLNEYLFQVPHQKKQPQKYKNNDKQKRLIDVYGKIVLQLSLCKQILRQFCSLDEITKQNSQMLQQYLNQPFNKILMILQDELQKLSEVVSKKKEHI